MKQLCIPIAVLVLFLTPLFSKAQQDWAPVGATWHYDFKAYPGLVGYLKIFCSEKKELEGKECSVLKKTLYVYDQTNQKFYDIEQGEEYSYHENGKIYLYKDGAFNVLYNFSANVGSSWKISGENFPCATNKEASAYKVDHTGIETIKGNELRFFNSNTTLNNVEGNWYMIGKIVERIGNIEEYMLPYPNCIHETDYKFRCYYDDSFGWYKRDDSVPCDFIDTDVTNVELKHLDISIHPIPANENLNVKIENSNLIFSKVVIYSSFGQKVDEFVLKNNSASLNISNLNKGIYSIKLTTLNGKKSTSRLFIKN